MHKGPPLHDPLAVAAILAPDMFNDQDGERFHVSVVRTGEEEVVGQMRRQGGEVGQCGRTIVKLLKKGEQGVRIPRGLEVDVFWNLLNMALHCVDEEAR
jgi:uridine nucleosidase